MFEFLRKIFSREGQATPKAPPKPAPAPSVPFDDDKEDDFPSRDAGPLPQELRAEGPLSEEERSFVLATLRSLVWSGFDGPDAMREAALESLDDWPDTPSPRRIWVEAQLEAMIAGKKREEEGWPILTDCDRLEAAFDALEDQGLIAIHAAGFSLEEARLDAMQEFSGRGGAGAGLKGVVFYTLQDVATALETHALPVHVSACRPGEAQADAAVAALVRRALEGAGLSLAAPGDDPAVVTLAPIEWRKRSPL